ncbi:RHS repeat-associated core domain-containing protein, partial [Micromonospora chersina]|uniref:RHS repeat-associated core domain-containing protein n=1 Tax=Micromonospora chersina TaxID=47854 RepID=UPI0037B4E9C8
RISKSRTLSATGGVGVPGGSVGVGVGTGDSTSLVDYLDMNGDGFPDVVGSTGIQYTDPTGGLGRGAFGTHDGTLPGDSPGARSSTNNSGSAKAGSASRTIQNGPGKAAPDGEGSARTAQSGGDLPPVGIGGDFGASTSDAGYDLIDINGDGLPDRVYDDGGVRLNLGYKFGAREAWRNPGRLNDGSAHSAGLSLGFNTDFFGFAGGKSFEHGTSKTDATLADVNGDGLPDRVFSGNPIRVGFNTGNGFEPPVAFGGSLDGIARDGNATLGGGVYAEFKVPLIPVVVNPGVNDAGGVGRTELALRDVNGDGYADHVSSTADDELVVQENTTGKTNLLRTVSLPLGGRMDFDYTRDGNTYDTPQSRFVLSKVSVDDKRPGDGQDVQRSTFEYSGGVFDRKEREFRGYGQVIVRQRDAGDGDAVLRSTTTQFRTDSPYTRGLAVKSFTTDAAGHKFTETENTYTVRDVNNPSGTADLASETATLFAFASRVDTRFFEGQATAGKSTFTTMDYDGVGNVVRSFAANEAGTGDDVDVVMHYSVEVPACQTTNITGTPTSVEVTGGGSVVRHRESTLDCATGNVTQVRAALNGTDTAVTDLDYFTTGIRTGNLKTVTGPVNKNGERFKVDYDYDTTVATYVESVTDVFGYHSTSTHDPKFGVETSSTDINNQSITTTYDTLGRPVTVTSPYEAADGKTSITFEYHPEAAVPFAVTRHADRQADNTVRTDTIDTITFTDGLGRVIQTKADAAVSTGPNTAPANVMVVSGRVDYDALGRAVKTFFPITEAKATTNTTLNPAFTATNFDTVTPTVTTYDVMDRPVHTALPDGTQASVAYGFGQDRANVTQFETIATDANNKTARSYTDVRGLTTTLKQFNPAGGAAQAVILTSYGYNALGEKTSIVDNAGNTTTMAYDNFGRNTSVISPDTGRTDMVYDLAGNPTKKITAVLAPANKAVEYDYDFNRLKAIRYPTFTTNNVTYTYGPPGAADNAANRITEIRDSAGKVTRKYGPLGETTEETRTVSVQGQQTRTFTTGYTYDTWNRVLKLAYPDTEVLSYRYNSGGQVDQATGVKETRPYTYLARLDYDKFGQRVLTDTGNATRTEYNYNSTTRRLEDLKAKLTGSTRGGYQFQNTHYTYDNVGNITALTNNTAAPTSAVGAQVGGPSTQTFTYDDLYRLTHATGTYTPAGKTDTYTQDLTYDANSNITNKNQDRRTTTSNGGTTIDNTLTYNNTYTYPTTGRTRAATTIGDTTTGLFTFTYDTNGNQISRQQPSGNRRQMIWDEENRIACFHENNSTNTLPQTPESCNSTSQTPAARFFYNDAGERIIKDGSTFHIYPNQNFSTDGNQQFKHIYIGNTKLLTKTREDGKTENLQFYTHDDHLGSTGYITDANGALAEHLNYIPGGETWISENPNPQPVFQTYTGKEQDTETGLYYHGARYYDPKFATWQNPDPALPTNATDTTSLSTYLYARANPLTYTDPDGR